jgi:hypothetical protein
LLSIDNRRTRFVGSSNAFLVVTVLLGVLFSILLAGLGFALVNDDAVGVGRELRVITRSLQQLERSATTLTPGRLRRLLPSVPDSVRVPMLAAFEALDLRGAIDSADAALRLDLPPTQRDEVEKAKEFLETIQGATEQLPGLWPELRNTLATVSTKVSTDEAKLAELVKRITLSIVIASFFFGILRYSATLYTHHLAEVSAADREEVAVRKFYLAFESAAGDLPSRTAAITEFISKRGAELPQSDAGSQAASGQIELLREVLQVLGKKL